MHNNKHTKQMTGFQCKYCFQKWQKRENMEKHALMCGFWHRSTQVHEDDCDSTPTITELFKVVKEFAYRCDKLQKRVDQLESRQNHRQKKQILDYLQEHPPMGTAIELFRTFQISREHLEIVFEDDLTSGIKACIKTHLHGTSLPICAFTQKSNTLYVFAPESVESSISKWHIMTNSELDKLISILSFKFLQAFVIWKKENCPQVETANIYEIADEDEYNVHTQAVNEQIKQQHQTYMIKINGQRVNEDKRRNDIKQMLYTYLQKPLPTVVELL
jgi:uncharacterized coiled-coil protein SlyX